MPAVVTRSQLSRLRLAKPAGAASTAKVPVAVVSVQCVPGTGTPSSVWNESTSATGGNAVAPLAVKAVAKFLSVIDTGEEAYTVNPPLVRTASVIGDKACVSGHRCLLWVRVGYAWRRGAPSGVIATAGRQPGQNGSVKA